MKALLAALTLGTLSLVALASPAQAYPPLPPACLAQENVVPLVIECTGELVLPLLPVAFAQASWVECRLVSPQPCGPQPPLLPP